jgi:MGT family glycosyltransferase
VPTLRTVLEGLVDFDADIVVTVGNSIDPKAVDLVRPNLIVRQFIPQGALLGRCQLVVNHGGSGSVLGPLHYGVPLLIVPMGADQLENAEMLEAGGVARVIEPGDLTARRIATTARAIVDNDELRRNAIAARDEIAAMATPADVVPELEALAR